RAECSRPLPRFQRAGRKRPIPSGGERCTPAPSDSERSGLRSYNCAHARHGAYPTGRDTFLEHSISAVLARQKPQRAAARSSGVAISLRFLGNCNVTWLLGNFFRFCPPASRTRHPPEELFFRSRRRHPLAFELAGAV